MLLPVVPTPVLVPTPVPPVVPTPLPVVPPDRGAGTRGAGRA